MSSASEPRRRPRVTRRNPLARLLFVVLASAALMGPGAVASAQTAPAGGGPSDITAQDVLLLTKVRQAGLWEMPSGMMGETKGSTQVVRDVAFNIMVDHGRIDVLTRQLAQNLGIALPNTPSPEQQGWLNEEANATGPAFDQVFANRLRAAHGQVFNIIAQLRAGTRDPQIRAFAIAANQAVMRHMTMLESTGLVDYSNLPAPDVSANATPASSSALNLSTIDIVVALVVVLGLAGGLVYGLRHIKGHRGSDVAWARGETRG